MGLRIVCQVVAEESAVSFIWSEGADSFEPYRLSGPNALASFRRAARESRTTLRELVESYHEDDAERARQCRFDLARHGYALHQAIFSGAGAQIRAWLTAVHDTTESLEIVVDAKSSRAHENIDVPWNVVYEVKPNEADFAGSPAIEDPLRHFWGRTYNLAIGLRADPLRRRSNLKDPRLLLVLDQGIVQNLSPPAQARLNEFIARHGPTQAHTCAELDAALQDRPDIIYWFSHASPDLLQLGDDSLSPHGLYEALRLSSTPGRGGIVFLNACQTGEKVSGEGAFLNAVTECGMSGIIGTEQQTIDNYANEFGLEFLDRFLGGEAPIAALMRDLRSRHPLGLLYSTYCPPHIVAARPATADADVVAPASTTAAAPVRVEAAAVAGAPLRGDATASFQVSTEWPLLPPYPYAALSAYQKSQRALFAGRRDDCDRFVSLLNAAATRLLVLQGASGVGKTSFLQAEVIPFLEEKSIGYRFLRSGDPGSDASILFVRAGKDLVAELAHALWEATATPYTFSLPIGETVARDLRGIVKAETGCNSAIEFAARLRENPALLHRLLTALAAALPFALVLIVDQAEEIFTHEQGSAATDALQKIGEASDGDYKVIVSLRTEYYGRLVDALRSSRHRAESVREYLLTDFSHASLCDVIERPTLAQAIPYASEIPRQKYGFFYSPGLAEAIAEDVREYASQSQDSLLPLVQMICSQLYSQVVHRGGEQEISASDLAAIGGVSGGMVRHIEALLQQLLPDGKDQAAMKHLLARLFVEQPDGALTTGLVPESSLAREWRGKLPYDDALEHVSRSGHRLLKRIFLNEGNNAPEPYLSLGHDSLARVAKVWRDEERTAIERSRRRKIVTLAVCVTGLVITALVAFALLMQREKDRTQIAQEATQDALRRDRYHKAAAKAQLSENSRPDLAVLLAVEANRQYDDEETRSALMAVLESEPRLTAMFSGHPGGVCLTAVSPDGALLATLACNGALTVWQVSTRQPLHRMEIDAAGAKALAIQKGNLQIAVAYSGGNARLWNIEDGSFASDCRFRQPPVELSPEAVEKPPGEVELTSDGLEVASVESPDRIILTRLAGCEKVDEFSLGGRIGRLVLSANGHVAALGRDDGSVDLVERASRKKIGSVVKKNIPVVDERPIPVSDIDLSPDGRTVAVSYFGSSLVSVKPTGEPEILLQIGESSRTVRLNSDSSRLAVAHVWNGSVFLQNLAKGWGELPLKGHTSAIGSLEAMPGGNGIVSAGPDDYAALWNLDAICRLCIDVRSPLLEGSASFDPTGNLYYAGVASPSSLAKDRPSSLGSKKTALEVWDGITSRVVVNESVSGRIVAAVRNRALVREPRKLYWVSSELGIDVGAEISQAEHAFEMITEVATSGDATVVAYAREILGQSSTVEIWSEAVVAVPKPFRGVFALHLSSDGHQLIVADETGDVTFWDTQALGAPTRTLAKLTGTHIWKRGLVNRDGSILVEGEVNRIRLWDLRSGRQIGTAMTEHSSPLYTFAFSRDGRFLASGAGDGTIRLWNVSTQQVIGPPLSTGSGIGIGHLEFSPDGKRLLSVENGGRIRIWRLDSESLRTIAGEMVTRNLTRAEWAQHFGADEPYRRTFEQLPEPSQGN